MEDETIRQKIAEEKEILRNIAMQSEPKNEPQPEADRPKQIPAVRCCSCTCFDNRDFYDKNYGRCVKLTLYIHGENIDDTIAEPDHYVVHSNFGCIYHIDSLTLKGIGA